MYICTWIMTVIFGRYINNSNNNNNIKLNSYSLLFLKKSRTFAFVCLNSEIIL